MIDTHCHLLHGLDDGPQTLAGAVALATSMTSQGIRRAVCTPHVSRQFPTDHDAAGAALEELDRELVSQGVPLSLSLASEMSEPNAATLPASELRRRAIAGRYVVVELEHRSTAATAAATVRRLVAAELVPVIAHPERLPAVEHRPDLLRTLRLNGALVQVVAPSLTGHMGRRVARTAWSLLVDGIVDLVASDAHGARRRRCHMLEAGDLVSRRLGQDIWRRLAEDAPAKLLEGGELR